MNAIQTCRGYTMIEVLVALVVLAIGILGLAGLMTKMHLSETESYQRAQALILLQEMSSRVAIAGVNANAYVTSSPLGTGDSSPTSCSGLSYATLDQCEWSRALKGAAESQGSSSVGAMIGARGCVELIQAMNAAPKICTPGIYRVSVVWQGLTATAAPSGIACGKGNYGTDDALRRALSTEITIGLPACT